MNLFEKILAVANDIKSIEKDMQVGTGNYAYKAVSDLNVTKTVKEAENRHKLLSIPTTQELVHHEIVRTVEKENKERIVYSFIVKMTVLFVDVENPSDRISVETFGHGLDSSDKGFGKASTYARKYALLNAYKIATGEDPDSEASGKTTVAASPSEKRIAVLNHMMKSTDLVQQTLRYFNAPSVDDLTEKDIETLYSSYKTKGLV